MLDPAAMIRATRVALLTAAVAGSTAGASSTTPAYQNAASRFVLATVVDRDGQPLVGLTAEDFIVQEGATRCDPLNASPAQYPIAVVVDTTHAARAEFMRLSMAVRRFIDGTSGRDIALYTFGDRATREVEFTRDPVKLRRAAEGLFARPDAESHVLDAIIEAAKDIQKLEAPVALIVVVSAGSNDQSSRSPREVFEPVVASRSIVQVVEMRTPRASGRLINPRGRRTSTTDRAAEAALGLEELLRAIAERTRGRYDLIYSSNGYASRLEELHRELAAEVVIEYAAPDTDGPRGPLQIGARLPGATVRGMGLDRPPRDR